LTPNNVVFKLVGPVLVKQDQAEAKANVDKRLEFIRGETSVLGLPPNPLMTLTRSPHRKRIEAQLQDIEQRSEKKKLEVLAFVIYELIILSHLL